MLIKWIVCTVEAEARQAFSISQAGWGDLREVPGFIGQIGGWEKGDSPDACIVAFWKDEMTYKNFMENYHDRIYENNGQKGTYRAISVKLSSESWERSAVETLITSAISEGQLEWENRTILLESSWNVLSWGK